MKIQYSVIQTISAALRAHMQSFGYTFQRVDLIQPANLFVSRAGDQVIDRLFLVERHGQQYAFIPEFTAAAAAKYVTENQTHAVRWQFSGPIFDDTPEGIDRHFEQYSIGAELIGEAGSVADAEIIAMAAGGLPVLHAPDWKVVLGHVGIQLALLDTFGFDARTRRLLLSQRSVLKQADDVSDVLEKVLNMIPHHANAKPDSSPADDVGTYRMLDVLLDSTRYGMTMGGRTREDIAVRLLDKHERATERDNIISAIKFLHRWAHLRGSADDVLPEVERFIDKLGSSVAKSLFAEWLNTIEQLSAYGVSPQQILIQPDLTRNWEYYTGMVFGIEVDDGVYAAGGGRYDDLTALFGGDATPAVGFAYYVDNLVAASQIQGTDSDRTWTLFGEQQDIRTIEWLTRLRTAGIHVVRSGLSNSDLVMMDDGTLQYKNNLYDINHYERLVDDLRDQA